MSMEPGWLTCKISDGMFPEEYAVSCTSSDNNTYSFFAYKGLVNYDAQSVKVNILEWIDDHCLVNLPVTPFENHGRTIIVNKNLITAA